ncbi:MAG: thioredoxin domain-containing protein [Pseudomonadota bacterium]
MRIARRLLIGLTALAFLPAVTMAARPALRPDDMTLGSPKARVVVVEYGSLSCPHCAHFHHDVFPEFKARFIDTGKVRFVWREYVTAPAEVAIPATMLARCAGADRYFKVIDRVFAVQKEIFDDGTVRGVHRILRREAAALGIDGDAYDACVRDEAAFEALKTRLDQADADQVPYTPYFVVNGKPVERAGGQAMDLATLEAAIKAAK